MQSGGSAGDDDDKEEEAKEVFLSPGALVDIANVKSKPELNGRAAKVIGFDEEKGRYLVELLEGGKEKVALKRKCLLEGKKTGREEDAAAFFQKSPFFEEEKRTKKQKVVVEEDETKEKENIIKVVDKNDDDDDTKNKTKKKEEEAKKTVTKKKTTTTTEKSGADEADKRRKYAQKSLWFTPWNEKNNFDKFDPAVPVDANGKYAFPNEDESEIASLEEKYKAMKIDELKKWCKANGYTTSGKKDELVHKCIDGELYGGLPKCPHCAKGNSERVPNLNVRYESPYHVSKDKEKLGRGEVYCPGTYDTESMCLIRCNFSKKLSEFERPKWRTYEEYLIENPPLTEEEKKKKEEEKKNKVNSNIPTEKLRKLAETGVQGSVLATKIFQILNEEKLSCPDNLAEAGSQIMAWMNVEKNVNDETGDVLLEEVFKDALEVWPKQKAKSETQALCAENQPLVDALNDLVMKARKLGTNVVEPFKVNAYAGAAKNISLLDYDVTKPGSGKSMLGKTVKGQKVGKVAGIGKGIAEMIDHWIDNGRTTFGKKWEEEGFDAAAA
jgi:hypothetical protein|tara:strand:- start:4946 stop:6607 length:1662 start_codon:yes stop_codon:yes gene_type:complete